MFSVKEFSFIISISKMDVKINLRITTKNHTADPQKGFLTKLISKVHGRAMVMSTARELNKKNLYLIKTGYKLMVHRSF